MFVIYFHLLVHCLLLVTITVTTTMLIMFFSTTNNDYDQRLVSKQPTNEKLLCPSAWSSANGRKRRNAAVYCLLLVVTVSLIWLFVVCCQLQKLLCHCPVTAMVAYCLLQQPLRKQWSELLCYTGINHYRCLQNKRCCYCC